MLRVARYGVLLVLLAGCASPWLPGGYKLGPQSLYRHDVQTVHVPIAVSEVPGTNIAERLTEAVAKEIENRTPFKVVGPSDADSVLHLRLTLLDKHLVVPSPTDEARMLRHQIGVEATWINRITGQSVMMDEMPVDQAVALSRAWRDFAPEAGQSRVTTEQVVLNRLAQQIVNQMECDW